MEDEKKHEEAESLTGRDIHLQAEEEREHGDLFKALDLCDQAAAAYERDHDFLGQAEVLSSKVITLRHIARRGNNRDLLVLAQNAAEEAVEVSRKLGRDHEEASTLPLFNLAEIQEELGNLEGAVLSYRQAAGQLLPLRHNLPAVRADMQIHLATCEYNLGDKDALARAEEWLSKLEQSEHSDSYAKDVWLSGGHMRIADAVRRDNPNLAKDHLSKAKTVIDSDPQKFHLRQEQWSELSARIV